MKSSGGEPLWREAGRASAARLLNSESGWGYKGGKHLAFCSVSRLSAASNAPALIGTKWLVCVRVCVYSVRGVARSRDYIWSDRGFWLTLGPLSVSFLPPEYSKFLNNEQRSGKRSRDRPFVCCNSLKVNLKKGTMTSIDAPPVIMYKKRNKIKLQKGCH